MISHITKFLLELGKGFTFIKGKLIILFNAFQKKTQKTPSNELDKAVALMKEYFENQKQ
ncbi:type II toxin-antitoxin system RelE/ParE family toxin [Pedobacter aquatilis]|uniref:type II toxin-antitoxin system RelE/ParE family toxin n=1 Tax=Pedobacter aquatilis TaxID=351343 RepID=UPI00292EC9BC|nr:type II toxin-antitoxin system RelE/ParE family toxin [Pedobacter aquatilis]